MDIRELIQVKEKKFRRHPWELARVKMLVFFISRYKSHNSILDIGSGDAFLAASIAGQFKNSSVTAIDISYTDELINELKKNYPANLHFLNSLNQFKKTGKTDIVILMDVLEHVEDPAALLYKVISHPTVTEDTIFIITVPAFQTLFSQHDVLLGHYKRYTLRSLKNLLAPLSITSRYNGYCFNSLLPVRFFQVFFKKLTGKKELSGEGIHNWKGGKWLTSFITNLFWLEFKISWYLARIGIKIPGLTCYTICQRFP